MHETDNLKFVKWFELAKKIVNDNPSMPTVLSNEEFVKYVNTKVPIAVKISKSYIDQILYYNPNTSTLPSKTEEIFGEQFRDWWFSIRVEQQLRLYNKMNTNERGWQREMEILARRYRHNWAKETNTELTTQNDVTINILEDKVEHNSTSSSI